MFYVFFPLVPVPALFQFYDHLLDTDSPYLVVGQGEVFVTASAQVIDLGEDLVTTLRYIGRGACDLCRGGMSCCPGIERIGGSICAGTEILDADD